MGSVADWTRPTVATAAKSAIRRSPRLHRLLYRLARRRRVANARRFMEIGALYPQNRNSILADHAYACSNTDRGIGQSLNLETSIEYLTVREIPGSIVECGTYTGGALAYALRSLMRHGDCARDVYGFDSFEGMPNPTPEDGEEAAVWILRKRLSAASEDEISGRLVGSAVNRASYEQCLSLLHGTGYPRERIHLVKGWFQESLPQHADKIGAIALLRLDGDLYESTKVCLDSLYDAVVEGGVVIVDDYGTFEGCRRAIDEFIATRQPNAHLVYVDVGIRYFIKSPWPSLAIESPAH